MTALQSPHVILGLFLLVSVLLLATLGRKTQIHPRGQKAWGEVARRLGGRLLAREGDLRVRFRWNGVEAALFQGDPVRFSIADAGLAALSLTLSERKGPVPKEPGVDSVPGFYLAAGDFPRAKEFFSPGVRKLLDDLESLGHVTRIVMGKAFEVTATPGPEPDTLVRFVSLCLQLAQHARVSAGREDGVKVVAESATEPGLCQICGADLEGELVSCASCATRHHRDCWDYTGICSTYGCGGRRVAGPAA